MPVNRRKFPIISGIAILLVSFLLLTSACQVQVQPAFSAEENLLVTVSIPPQAYFIKRIGGDAVSVNVMVGPGEEAHTYEPTPDQMKALTGSRAFFSIGVEYEMVWIPRFKEINPEMTIVNSAEGIELLPMTDMHTHDDGEGFDEDADQSSPGSPDPHVWLSPQNGKIIAANILRSLTALAPNRAEFFKENYDQFILEIDSLDENIIQTFSNTQQRSFIVFHPAWAYFADQYDLQQIPVQVGGQEPSAREMADLISLARQENIRVIFIQPTFSTMHARAIASEINAEIVVVDPLAEDWLSNLQTAANAFAAAFKR